MAQIGLKYLVCAKVNETNTDVTYDKGMVMSNAIKADVSIEINEAKLYADDRIVENIKEFKSGKVSLNGDNLTYAVQSLILGHTLETIQIASERVPSEQSEPFGEPKVLNGEKLIAKGDDDGAFVGVGFYATTIKGGVRKYRAIWLRKVKFGIPNESLETKGDAINFQTPTIEGTVLTDILGFWKEECLFETEQGAVTWLNTQASMIEETEE